MQNSKKANSIIFVTILLVLGVINTLKYDRALISEQENRRLAEIPEITVGNYVDGSLSSGIDEFLKDRFVFRKAWIDTASKLSKIKGIQDSDDFMLVATNGANEGDAGTALKELTPSNQYQFVQDTLNFPDDVGMLKIVKPTESVDVTKIEFAENFKTNVLIYDEKGMTSYVFKKNLIDRLANAYNDVEASYSGTLNIYALTAPSRVAFVDEDYARYTDNQYLAIQSFYSKLDTRIIKIDPYPMLAMHQDEYIYFKTDHHWTSLGAYYGYVSACISMGLVPKAIEDFDELLETNFLGSLYDLTQSDILKANEDSILAYVPRAELTYRIIEPGGDVNYSQVISKDFYTEDYKYDVFLGGDYNLAMIENSSDDVSDETIMFIKDSYGNALIPYFTNHFKRILIVDPRYNVEPFSELIKTYDVHKLVIQNNGQTLASESYVDILENLN